MSGLRFTLTAVIAKHDFWMCVFNGCHAETVVPSERDAHLADEIAKALGNGWVNLGMGAEEVDFSEFYLDDDEVQP